MAPISSGHRPERRSMLPTSRRGPGQDRAGAARRAGDYRSLCREFRRRRNADDATGPHVHVISADCVVAI